MDQPKSRFRKMTVMLRAILTDEKNRIYLMHTPVGVINVNIWNYTIPDFIIVGGDDEAGNYRFLVFPEEAACSFPLEVKPKASGKKKGLMGFKAAPTIKGDEKTA